MSLTIICVHLMFFVVGCLMAFTDKSWVSENPPLTKLLFVLALLIPVVNIVITGLMLSGYFMGKLVLGKGR